MEMNPQMNDQANTIDRNKETLHAGMVSFFRKYRIIFGIAIAASLVVLAVTFLIKSKHYQATLVATTSLSNDLINVIVNSLNQSVEAGDLKRVASRLNIPEADARRLTRIRMEDILTEEDFRPAVTLKGKSKSWFFLIMADFSEDPAGIRKIDQPFTDRIRDGIFSMINNNSFVRRRERNAESRSQEVIKQIDLQIRRLDSLQNKLVEQRIQSEPADISLRKNNMPIWTLAETSQELFISSEVLTLFERKAALQESLKSDQPIMMVEDFIVAQDVRQRIPWSLAFQLISAILGLTLLVTLFAELALSAKQKQ